MPVRGSRNRTTGIKKISEIAFFLPDLGACAEPELFFHL